jgi:hypothetical protein
LKREAERITAVRKAAIHKLDNTKHLKMGLYLDACGGYHRRSPFRVPGLKIDA